MYNPTEMSFFAKSIMEQKYSHDINGGKETWDNISYRVVKNVLKAVDIKMSTSIAKDIYLAHRERKIISSGRYLASSGLPYHQTQSCLALKAEDSRESWADTMRNSTIALMTGAGIGNEYSALRAEGKKIRKTGGVSSGPLALVNMVNEAGRWVMQGGSRRSAIWAGLNWKHQDILKFIHSKDWSKEVRALKAKDYNFPAPLDLTNISVGLDEEFFLAFHDEKHTSHSHAQMVFWEVINQMVKTGEPGFTVDIGVNAGETLRNACTEFTGREDSTICNLGSINLARVESVEEFKDLLEMTATLLIAGSVYSDVPYPKVDQIRNKNRPIGIGLMGIHEWLLRHGKKYGPDSELEEYLKVYATSTKIANKICDKFDISRCIKTRALAPNGTVAIVGETTGGIETIYCAAYKRRYKKGMNLDSYQYVLDPTAKRLVDDGFNPDDIEDAYTVADNVERRVEFQAWIQKYVDHGISSTINLPSWGSEKNNESTVKDFGNMLIKHLPNLRGITAYPDGARDGQPLTPIKYSEAAKFEGQVFVEQVDVCDITKKGSCGS